MTCLSLLLPVSMPPLINVFSVAVGEQVHDIVGDERPVL